MGVEKLSISLDAELAGAVRTAAAADEVSISTWFADAAADRVRQQRLRHALATSNPEVAALSNAELDRAVAQIRRDSVLTTRQRHAA